MMLNSDFRELYSVELPYKGRQKYMYSFDIKDLFLLDDYKDYSSIVTDLLKYIGLSEGRVHVTIDEKIVKKGMSQRRPGPHVDGCFMEYTEDKKTNYWDHPYLYPPIPSWAHYCNHIPSELSTPIKRMPVIIAASEPGCRVWRGKFKGFPKNDGDLSHIKDQLGYGEILNKNKAYLLSPDCVHESMIFNEDTYRTFLRIALPTDFDFYGNKI